MGRELRRVPFDFDWELHKVWKGYVNPYSGVECVVCHGGGYSPEAQKLNDQWYGWAPFKPEDRGSVPFKPSNAIIAERARRNVVNTMESYYPRILAATPEKEADPIITMAIAEEAVRLCELFNSAWMHHLNQDDVNALVNNNRLWDFTREYTSDKGWVDKNPPYIPTAEEVNRWSILCMGHDSCNAWVCIKAECERKGISSACPACGGGGELWVSDEIRQKAEEWVEEEPPLGDGFQLWETTSEGSPVSPVFETLDALCEWAEGHAYTFADFTATAAEWKTMLLEDNVYHQEGNLIFI